MGELIPFKRLTTPFDGWEKQTYGSLTDYAGGRCVWGHLIDKMGRGARDSTYLRKHLGSFAEWLRDKLALDSEFKYKSLKRSLTFTYGPEAFPLNVLIYANDHLKLCPEDFRTMHLEWQFAKEENATTV